MDVVQEGDEYRLLLEVPGAEKDGIEVVAGPVDGTVIVRARTKQGKRPDQVLHSERGAHAAEAVQFERIVPVAWDADVEGAKHSLANGILTVRVPRKAPTANKQSD